MARPREPHSIRSQRGHYGPPVQLAAGRRGGRPPAWPLADPPTPDEAAVWRDLWSRPQSDVWRATGATRTIARLARVTAEAERPDADQRVRAEARLLEISTGASAAGMARLGWVVVAAPTPAPLDDRRRAIRARVGLGDDGEPVGLRAVEE
jgi:hypothetical protein